MVLYRWIASRKADIAIHLNAPFRPSLASFAGEITVTARQRSLLQEINVGLVCEVSLYQTGNKKITRSRAYVATQTQALDLNLTPGEKFHRSFHFPGPFTDQRPSLETISGQLGAAPLLKDLGTLLTLTSNEKHVWKLVVSVNFKGIDCEKELVLLQQNTNGQT